MVLKVYEYEILDPKVGSYIGSYTIREGCPREAELQKQFYSHLVQTFEHNYH